MLLRIRRALQWTLAFLLLGAATAHAQYIPRPPDEDAVRVQVGPLWLNPSISLTHIGWDTNVFNEADVDDPDTDFTITATPQSDFWLRMGRTWLTANVREDIVWYREFTSERSVNQRYALGWVAPLTRIGFAAGASWLDTRERPGFEIDARAERKETGLNAAVELRALSRTFVGVRADQRTVEFDPGAAFLGRSLREELNREERGGAVTLRHELTPLTHLTFEAARQNDRFDFNPLRDSNTTRLQGGLTFDPAALIAGSAQVGYRKLDSLASDVPDFTGLTTNVALTYTASESTRAALLVNRDVQYSFEAARPYYLETGVAASIAQQIYGPVDAQARIGARRLSYRERAGVSDPLVDRVDRVRSWGVGLGYRFGVDLRIGFNVDQQTRTSAIVNREYEGLRAGLSVTYGL